MAWLPVMAPSAPGADLLHGLVAGHGAERVDEVFLSEQRPQPVGTHLGERITDLGRAAKPLHVLGGIGTFDTIEPALLCAWNQCVKICHCVPPV